MESVLEEGFKVVPVPMVKSLIVVIAPANVLVLPFDKIRLQYVMALILWAPVPLKFTVLGADEVTFKVPEVMVIALAIPRTELADNCNDVPLSSIL